MDLLSRLITLVVFFMGGTILLDNLKHPKLLMAFNRILLIIFLIKQL